jgi:2,4-dienoyl-CoA reductase-like NADH-dependent reductase (Old Yellow Enzyme family)
MSERPVLFQPIQIAGLTLPNRVVGLPIGLSGFVDSGAAPTDRLIAMYRRRAAGGAALITVEATYVEPGACARPGLLGFYTDHFIPQFSVLAEAIHDAGAAAAIQLTDRWHANFPYHLHELATAEIQAMFDHWARGAERAVRAGFDAINIQGAHGWPLSRFLSPRHNDRADGWREPAAAPAAIVRRIRGVVGPRVPIIFRLSLDEYAPGGLTAEFARDQVLPLLEDAGVDVLDLTFGGGPISRGVKAYLGTEPIYNPPGERAATYQWARERLRVPLLGRSRITDPAVAIQMVEEGVVDLLGVGRQLLADPDFPLKTEQRRWTAINRCVACDVCLASSTVWMKHLRCTVNPSLGRELEGGGGPLPARVPRRVHIVGGGIAGLEAARGLARGGHRVTLWEQDTELGGLLRLVARMPALNLRDLAYYCERLIDELPALGVDTRLGTRCTASALAAAGGDTVVLATGAAPARLARPEAATPVIPFTAYLAGDTPLGERVVVVGHGEGAEFAVSLARRGHQVWLVERGVEPAAPAYDYAGRRIQALRDHLADAGVGFVGLAEGAAAVEGGVQIRYRNGRESTLVADAVLCAGRVAGPPAADLVPPGWEACTIGDAVAPRGLMEALHEARVLVQRLQR